MTPVPIALLALSLLLAIPGALLLRHTSIRAQLGAIALLLAATASGYTGVRLHQDTRRTELPTAPAITLTPGTGRFQTIPADSLAASLAASRGHPVMLEFHADWCPSCVRWQREVFSRDDVREALRPLILLQIDASRMTPEIQAILGQYQLPGLPAMLFFDRTGQEQTDLRLLGEMSADEFKAWLAPRLASRL